MSVKPILIILAICFMLSAPTSALQQTIGNISINTTPGNSTSVQYGIRNDANDTVTVEFRVTGSASKYLEYPETMVFNPNHFRYVTITSHIPEGYTGPDHLYGTIYISEQSSADNPVRVKVELGKNIDINIVHGDSTPVPVIIAVVTVTIVLVLMYFINKHSRKYKLNKKGDNK